MSTRSRINVAVVESPPCAMKKVEVEKLMQVFSKIVVNEVVLQEIRDRFIDLRFVFQQKSPIYPKLSFRVSEKGSRVEINQELSFIMYITSYYRFWEI